MKSWKIEKENEVRNKLSKHKDWFDQIENKIKELDNKVKNMEEKFDKVEEVHKFVQYVKEVEGDDGFISKLKRKIR